LNGLNQSQSNYEDTLEQGIEVRRLSNQLTISLLKARENERNFLLRWRQEGFDTAYANYATLHTQNVAKMRVNLEQLAVFSPMAETISNGNISQIDYEINLASLTRNVDAYEKSFNSLVNAYHKKGFDEESDFESQFRTAAVNMEYYLYGNQLGVDQIKITYLRLRFSEKNYLADAQQSYANDIHSFIPLLKEQIAVSDTLKPADKAELLSQVDAYVTAFDGLVELDKQIAVYNQELITAASAVEAQAAKIENLGNQLAIYGINTARANNTQTFTISVLTVFVVLVLSILLAVTFSQQLTRPLIQLTRVAQEISEGNFHIKAEEKSADEIGTLTQTINNMSDQLLNALQSLENRAEELKQRTIQLELTSQQSEKRAQELKTIEEIGRNISIEKNIQKLLPSITQIVSERFGFYHVGIFLVDDSRKFAVLLASNSPGGQEMLRRQHSLEVGQTGIVGNVTATGIPRIAADTGKDAVFFDNPYLPQTRSELALPLITEGQVIGALDIQSTEINAFGDEDVEILTVLADQVSLAIQNARLFNQIEKSLAEANALQRQYIHETWGRVLKEEKLRGYRYSLAGAIPLDRNAGPAENEEKKNKQEVNVPIVLRGETIGTLSVRVPKSEHVGTDQMDLIKAVAERVAISAENARLFDETTRRAESERIISDIASKIGTSFRTESILRTTASELSQLLEDADIFIDLNAKTTQQNKKENE
jgi:GAF domain-containing protein/HAMP domain-containing protein